MLEFPFKPDGRKCKTCRHKDSDNDPVSAHRGLVEQMWWGSAPSKDTGETVRVHCGYCTRTFLCRIKMTGKTLTDWETDIANDPQGVEKQEAIVECLIKSLCESGKERQQHVDWDAIMTESLEKIESLDLVIKHPGWNHIAWCDYEKGEHNALAVHGQVAEGHRRATFEGVDGVLVPKANVMDIDYNHTFAAPFTPSTTFLTDSLSVRRTNCK